jgi:hypothetical protein
LVALYYGKRLLGALAVRTDGASALNDSLAQLAFLAYLIVAAVLLAAVVAKAVWHLIGPLLGI